MPTQSDVQMSLGYVIFYVADVKSTLAHWTKAFGYKQKFLHESGQYGELETGNTTLAFVDDALMERQGVRYRQNRSGELSGGAQVSFVTRTPDAAFARALENGARTVKSLEAKPWGQSSGFVQDQNGILIEICTPIEHR